MDSLRVPLWFVADAERLTQLLDRLDMTPRLVEEVMFFTSHYHCAQTLAALERTLPFLRQALAATKARGYRVGLNHLTTIGHHEENLELAAPPELRRMVDLEGKVCRGSLCPADPAVRDYVAHSYRLLANCQPDFIMVDDDVRLLGHMPAEFCCACDGCLADFSKQADTTYTRAALTAALSSAHTTERQRVRRLFMQRNARVLAELLSLIQRTVHEVDDHIDLGFMTGDRYWEGYAFDQWAQALRGRRSAVRWRPGGGFYSDDRPADLLDKMHSLGRQNACLPPYVTVNQSEIENFPYQALRKSARINVLEATAYLLVGCTGSAFNILGAGPVREHAALLDQLQHAVPLWRTLKSLLAGSHPSGLWPAWDPLQAAAGDAGHFDQSFGAIYGDMLGPYALAGLGLPVCYRPEYSRVTVLSGRMPLALGDAAVRQALSTAVLLDARALQCAHDMGLGELTGVTAGRGYDSDTQECFVAHAFNGDWADHVRDCRQSFRWWNVPAIELLPAGSDTEVLARLKDYQGRDRGASLTVHRNSLGGRVAVMSYFPWSMHTSLPRRTQLFNVCDWLSSGTLDVLIHPCVRVTPIVRRHPDGKLVVGLLNLSGDTYEATEITIRSPHRKVSLLMPNGSLRQVSTNGSSSGLRLQLPTLQPWSFTVVCVGDFTGLESK